MPSTSGKQHRFFGMASTPEGRAKLQREGKKVPPVTVAKEFLNADKGKHFSALHRRHAAAHHALAHQHEAMAEHMPHNGGRHRSIAGLHRQIAAHHEAMI